MPRIFDVFMVIFLSGEKRTSLWLPRDSGPVQSDEAMRELLISLHFFRAFAPLSLICDSAQPLTPSSRSTAHAPAAWPHARPRSRRKGLSACL
jgi:hypothetical protein